MNKTKIWAFGISIVMVLMMLTTVVGIASAVDLLAGRNLEDVGSVTVWDDGTTLFVKYETTGNWFLSETHLAVETSPENISQNKAGNPIPGKFDYKTDHSPPTTSYTYVILLGDWEVGETLVVAAHAVVQLLDEYGDAVQEETAWGKGDPFDGKNWAMYFEYTVQGGGTC